LIFCVWFTGKQLPQDQRQKRTICDGKKVILVGCTLYWQRSWRDRVNAIDRVFHMLDGKGASVQDAYYSNWQTRFISKTKARLSISSS
jgi:hypothetical protein